MAGYENQRLSGWQFEGGTNVTLCAVLWLDRRLRGVKIMEQGGLLGGVLRKLIAVGSCPLLPARFRRGVCPLRRVHDSAFKAEGTTVTKRARGNVPVVCPSGSKCENRRGGLLHQTGMGSRHEGEPQKESAPWHESSSGIDCFKLVAAN
jgi:hypothetical protein